MLWFALLITCFSYYPLSASAIGCYECDSSNNFTCTEFWDPRTDVTLPYLSEDCSHVFEVRRMYIIYIYYCTMEPSGTPKGLSM